MGADKVRGICNTNEFTFASDNDTIIFHRVWVVHSEAQYRIEWSGNVKNERGFVHKLHGRFSVEQIYSGSSCSF